MGNRQIFGQSARNLTAVMTRLDKNILCEESGPPLLRLGSKIQRRLRNRNLAPANNVSAVSSEMTDMSRLNRTSLVE